MAKRKTRDLLRAEFTVTVTVNPNDSSQTTLMSIVEDNIREALGTRDDREGFVEQFDSVEIASRPWRTVKLPIEQPVTERDGPGAGDGRAAHLRGHAIHDPT